MYDFFLVLVRYGPKISILVLVPFSVAGRGRTQEFQNVLVRLQSGPMISNFSGPGASRTVRASLIQNLKKYLL